MGELADDYRFMKEHSRKRRDSIEPKRFEYVEKQLKLAGCEITEGTNCEIFFNKDNISGKIYPYKGWWSAKGIGSDRGIKRLIKILNKIG